MDLEDVANKLREEEQNELLEVSKELKKITVNRVKIPIIDFETYLLPYILGNVEKTDANTMVFTNNYLKMTNNYRIGIDVVHNNEIVYKLPPLIMVNDIEDLENISFRKLINKFNSYSVSNPKYADNLMAKSTNVVANNLKTTNEKDIYIKELNKIFKDYKDRIKNNTFKNDVEGTKNEESIEDDLFDY